jgi:hypothetical protein
LVRNKVDLLTPAERAEMTGMVVAAERGMISTTPRQDRTISTSATTGEGISDLVAAIGKLLVPNRPPRRTAVPFAMPQVLALEAARDACERHEPAAVAEALQPLLAAQVNSQT